MKGSVRQGEVDAEKWSYRAKHSDNRVYKNSLISRGCSLSPLEAEGLDSNSMGQQERKAIQN